MPEADGSDDRGSYPVRIHVEPATHGRNRLTTAFRIILAIPHLILVGGPAAAVLSWTTASDDGVSYSWSGAGILGGVALVCAVIAWFVLVVYARHPRGLWDLAAFYLRWRVRAVAYVALLVDEYPPFGNGDYPARLDLPRPPDERDRVSVVLRLLLAVPHVLAVWFLGIAWGFTTVIAWFAILITGEFPAALHQFGVGVLRWNTRVEAYLLLLRDEYPPFALD